MRIANPLYDHAFKYLMSNDKMAKKVLSTILDQEVLELELNQQEIVVSNQEKSFTLFRLDFKALIVNDKGNKEKVLIELQKSKLPTNLLRFRNYLGYTYTQNKTDTDTSENESLYPIISIYILGYNLVDIPVMAAFVDRKIIDASTNEELDIESDFIDLLTHKCYILQTRRLPPKRQTRLEKFMTLFNQAWISEHNYILNLQEVPEEFQDIAAYLQRPLNSQEIIDRLAAEAEAELIMATVEARAKKAEAKAEEAQEKAKEAKKAEAKAEKAIKEKEQALMQEKVKVLKFAKYLRQLNTPTSKIAELTGLAVHEIESLE